MTTTRLCKYHGRSCEYPGRCLNNAPRKYDGDGHLENIDPERLTVGCVVRPIQSDGGFPAFADSMVTDIYVTWCQLQKEISKTHFDNLLAAIEYRQKYGNDYLAYIKLVRPYTFPTNNGPGLWVISVENFEILDTRLLHHYKVVVNSTGAYTCFPPL